MYTNKERDIAKEQYKSGKTLEECAAFIGCARSTVANWLKADGFKIRRRGASGYPKIEHAAVVEMFRAGKSFAEIQRKTGYSKDTIRNWIKKSR